jgi:hypothetical protein
LNLRVDVCVHMVDGGADSKLDQVLTKLGALQVLGEKIMATEQAMADALVAIDKATTKISDNLVATNAALTDVSSVVGTISTEVDALVLALQNAGVPQALIDQALSIGSKADAAGTATDAVVAATTALVPVLQGIASKGASNPVPVPVPPVPPPPATP